MGKPVISFGQHNFYNFLSHVKIVETAEELSSALYMFLGEEDEGSLEKRRQDGKRFQAAMVQTSFPMGTLSQWNTGGYDQHQFDECFRRFLCSLDFSASTITPEDGDVSAKAT